MYLYAVISYVHAGNALPYVLDGNALPYVLDGNALPYVLDGKVAKLNRSTNRTSACCRSSVQSH